MKSGNSFVFILILAAVAVIVWLTGQPIFSAKAESQLSPRAYLPFVVRQYGDAPATPTPTSTPKPPPSVAIDYVPPFSTASPYDSYAQTMRGHLENFQWGKTTIQVYLSIFSNDVLYSSALNCIPGLISPLFGSSTNGSFNFYFGPNGLSRIKRVRIYVTDLNYCPPQLSNDEGLVLPPDSTTNEVWAMTEITRSYPDRWDVTIKKP